jgi:pyruvate formate lyase activating enzyme
MLRVGGLTRLSATDYPGRFCAVVFCQGCVWRCGYCHNPHLLPRKGHTELAWAEVMAFLRRRRGLLDAVVFSGGEPTLQAGLAAAMQEVKALGFLIGLHTAGIVPRHLARVLPLVDWVGMDIKAPFADYDRVTGVPTSGPHARASMELILASGVACQFRTTVQPGSPDSSSVVRVSALLQEKGVASHVVQEARS